MKKSFIVGGLVFGDEGKGSVVDWLVREHDIKLVCRYNGAFQAAHNVVTPGGLHHTFSQYGSGTLVSDEVKTVIFSPVIVNPMSFLEERDILRSKGINTDDRVTVSSRCRIATPFHAMLNRVFETCLGDDRHGSCGQGIGIVASEENDGNCMYVEDLSCEREAIAVKMRFVRGRVKDRLRMHRYGRVDCEDYINEQIEKLKNMDVYAIVDQYLEFYEEVEVMEGDDVSIIADRSHVFEGAQGVLLDEEHGFFPHVTKSNCTFENALMLLDVARFDGEVIKVGVIRSYHTRHGNGPFPSESARMTEHIADMHNGTGDWQGHFRIGRFDAVLANYALDAVDGVDILVMTCVDRLCGTGINHVVVEYEGNTDEFMFRARTRVKSLVVNHNFDEESHMTRNEFLSQCCPVVTHIDEIDSVDDMPGLMAFADGIERLIDRKVDVISVSPTCEGKILL